MIQQFIEWLDKPFTNGDVIGVCLGVLFAHYILVPFCIGISRSRLFKRRK